MSERFNGRMGNTLPQNFGSDRRGVRPVPAVLHVSPAEQSKTDKENLIAGILERQKEKWGIGNRALPAFKHKAELVENINTHKATIVGGETGSGKSTQLPQFLYEAGYDLTIVLVPRRVIANELGERIRDEMSQSDRLEDFNAEEEIGIVHGERSERHDSNRIVVMTPNTYIRMAKELEETHAGKKVAIIADEIHEANLFTELAVGVAAHSVQRLDNWRLVAASATHNAETLEAPFQKINNGYVPKVEIKGRPFNVELREEENFNPMQAYAEHGSEHEKSMIFTSGKKEIQHIIEETKKELEKKERGSSEKVIFRILHGELTERELGYITEPIPEGYRLCIVSSPAGMSGITIPGVTFVATDGTINRAELDREGAEGLTRRYLSKAGIVQQIGRAGRDVAGGVGYLCKPVIIKKSDSADKETPETFKYKDFESREAHEPPEIWNTNLSRAALSMAALGYRFFDINDFIPHRVEQIDIINAEEALLRLGALDEFFKVTKIGIGMDEFPVAPEFSRGMYEIFQRGRVADMARIALIAAALDAGGVGEYSADADAEKRMRALVRSTTKSDPIAQLDIMMHLNRMARKDVLYDADVRELGLSPKRVERAMKVSKKALAAYGINIKNIDIPVPTHDEEVQLIDGLTTGFIDMTYEHVGKDPRTKTLLYRNIHGNKESVRRKVSNRSFTEAKEGEYIAGIPRWYEKGQRKDGTPIKHDIIDFSFAVDPKRVVEAAKQNQITQHRGIDVKVLNGRVVERRQEHFGSLAVGIDEVKSTDVELSTKEAQYALSEYILDHPGDTVKALRQLVESLEEMRRITPPEYIEHIRRADAPEDLTNERINELIYNYARETHFAHEVEEKLRLFAFSAGYSLSRYYSTEHRMQMKKQSPDTFDIGGRLTVVRYENGRPYVSALSRQQKRQLGGAARYLPDGREIFLSVSNQNGQRVFASLASLEG